jgi:hypothetical protein
MNQQAGPGQLVRDYLFLRKAVGIIGFALPSVLAIGNMILHGPGLERSISYYYYTDLRNVFVGSLCAIGVFLMSTKGYDKRDAIAGGLASVFAIGVALLPTTPDGNPTLQDKIIGALHLTSAALLFLTFAYFCLRLFTLTAGNPTPRKLMRNRVYRVCGWIILVSIGLIAVVHIPSLEKMLASVKPVFWLEALAVMTFGFAWLTKGEMILKDEEAATSKEQAGAAKRAAAN